MVLLLALIIGDAAWAAETAATNEKAVVVITIGKIDGKLKESVILWVEQNMSASGEAPVRDGGRHFDLRPYPAAAIARMILATNSFSNAVAVLALWDGDMTNKSPLADAVYATNGVGIVNVNALHPKAASSGEWEKYLRRVEKESIRALALASGLPPCPFFRCALWPVDEEAGWNYTSRNLCPPCGGRLEEVLREKGLRFRVE